MFGKIGKKVVARDKMQNGYSYFLTARSGRDFDKDFRPQLTPKQMLELGVFGGRYMRDCGKEFPKSWFARAKFFPLGKPGHDKKINFFKVDASQSLAIWQKKKWIHSDDPRGWFQWYCRYYMGRRHPDDARQIRRWRMMRRHIAQIKLHCRPGDWLCRRRQRQAVLHWAYDSRKM